MSVRLLFLALFLLFLWPETAHGACAVTSSRTNGQLVGYDNIILNLINFTPSQRADFITGMSRWNSSTCNIDGISFPHFTTGAAPPGSRTISVEIVPGFKPLNDQVCGDFVGSKINLYTTAKKPDGTTINCLTDADLADSAAHELGHTIGLNDLTSAACAGYAMDQVRFSAAGVYQSRTVKASECQKARDTNVTPSEQAPPPPPQSCECSFPSDCGPIEWGTWTCTFCQCLPQNSPLVVHLPDYFSSGDGNQSWWKRGFCGPEAPTVCLDWLGNGHVTCTAWTEPGSEIAFVVALSKDDEFRLQSGVSVHVEPWRHFFGNVTMGPAGDFFFVHGFAALAAHCGQASDATSQIDLTECGASLQVWEDRSGDGDIDSAELLDFQDLGIVSLGNVRKTGKKDRCGNTFPAESHATCSSHPGDGTCGTWLDVFFEQR
jgi:hypothetical protein